MIAYLTNRSSAQRLQLVIATIISLTFGCGDESGILLAVSGSSLAELEFRIGVAQGDRFVADHDVSGLTVDVDGRTLRTSPYKLLLHEPAANTDELSIRAIVLGYRYEDGERDLYAVGVMDPPQQFIRGQVLRRNISMRTRAQAANAWDNNGCVTASLDDERFSIAVPNNLDCDAAAADADPPDCDDNDSGLYPGAPEQCDGRDNNCDGALGPETSICYVRDAEEGGICRLGQRLCEKDGEGAGACTPGETRAPELYCEEFSRCAHLAEPTACLQSIVDAATASCTVASLAAGTVCGSATIQLSPSNEEVTSCKWSIVDNGGWTVGFGEEGKLTETAACAPTITIGGETPSTNNTIVFEFFDDGQPTSLFKATISPQIVTTCDTDTALQCE